MWFVCRWRKGGKFKKNNVENIIFNGDTPIIKTPNEKIIFDKGALISAEDTDPKILITKSDGSYLYLTTDLATVSNRIEKYDFDKTLYIVDKRQKLHFDQLFKSLDYFGSTLETGRLTQVFFFDTEREP